jgi:ABC-type antimicrobial peptide transport system permease subunit
LYQVDPYDPLALSLSLAVLVCVALASAYLPTQRAARIDPVKALRIE